MKAGLGLHRQLQLLGIVPALILLLLLVGLLTWQRFADAETELREQGEFLARHLASASEYGVLSGNRADLRRQARHAFEHENLRLVIFRDAAGRLLSREVAPDGEGSVDPDELYRFSASIYRQPAAMSEGTETGRADLVGEVVVGLSDHWVAARQREILLTSAAPVLMAILVALWIARRMGGNISRPLRSLSRLVRVIRDGDYHVRGVSPLDGELGTLQGDINELAANLEEARREQERAMRELVEARRRSESANQAKSEFLAMMSHELRTPMNGVLGMLQLMQTTGMDDEQGEYIQAALESTSHLMEVINDILDFSRIESGRLEIEELFFSPDELIQHCVMNFRYLAEEKGLDLNLHGLESLEGVQLRSDPLRLRQILTNLVSNAVKFTEHGGVDVHVELMRREPFRYGFRVRVRDSGLGIPEEQIPRLFEAFSQLENSTSRRFGGTGLGLAISRRLADLLGGRLWGAALPEGGSEFALELELEGRAACEVENTERPAGRRLEGRVLLVEDNDVNRMVAERMLAASGVDVLCARDGRHALEKLDESAVDCVLMDVQMPVMDGLEATRRLRDREAERAAEPVPVVALTANALEGERGRCLDAGMDDYVAKPFQRDQLLEVVSRYLRQPEEPA